MLLGAATVMVTIGPLMKPTTAVPATFDVKVTGPCTTGVYT